MAKAYKLQSLLNLNFDMGQDLSIADVTEVHYIKPDGTTGIWTATASGTILTYNTANGDLDQLETWYLWGYYEISGENARGKTVKLKIIPNDQ